MWKDNFFFRNANGFNVVNGKTRHSGVELSFTGDVTDWLSISGNGTLAKHTYDFTETVGSAANNITSGDRVDTAPDTLAHMRATLFPMDGIETEIEWRHVGSYFTNPGNTAKYPGHDVFASITSLTLAMRTAPILPLGMSVIFRGVRERCFSACRQSSKRLSPRHEYSRYKARSGR